MGNRAPLPSPPTPTQEKVVWSISTQHRICGTKLYILQKSHEDDCNQEDTSHPTDIPTTGFGAESILQGESRMREHETDTNNNDERDPCQEQQQASHNRNSTSPSTILPLPLRTTDISQSEFDSKIKQVEQTLHAWKGGWARCVLIVWGFVVVIGFLAAYLSPGFWSSTVISHPWFLLGLVIFQFLFLFYFIRLGRTETHQLIQSTTVLFRPWKNEYGIHVVLKQVADINLIQQISMNSATNHGPQALRRSHAGGYCFVLVFSVLRDYEMHNLDSASVRTVSIDEDLQD